MFFKFSTKFLGFLSIFSLLLNASGINCEENPTVEISNGKLEGVYEKTRDGNQMAQFLGIKYGLAPNRFQKPVPNTEKWEGVKKVQEYGDACIQYDFFQIAGGKTTGSEDCLFVNVYTRNLNNEKKLPVLVMIHGGGYMFETSKYYGGSYWMDEEIVYVNFNYRLGIYGFLSAGVKSASGNAGMKDQVLALKWIQENIEKFGGDPEQVTIMGESAGASAVSFHLVSPMSKGLFRAAISQSGNVLNPWSVARNPVGEAKKLANIMDCPTGDLEYMVSCLAKIDPVIMIEKEMENKAKNQPSWITLLIEMTFVPTLENIFEGEENDTFLTDYPYNLLKTGNFNKVPWIQGANNYEGLFVGGGEHLQNLDNVNKHWGRFAPIILNYELTAPDRAKISNQIHEFYFSGSQDIVPEDRENFIDMLTDRWFLAAHEEAAKMYSKFAPTYLYMFDYKGIDSYAEFVTGNLTDELKRPTHGDDILYQYKYLPGLLVNYGLKELRQYGDRFYEFSKAFIRLWVSFVENGKPTDLWNTTETWTQVNPEEDPVKWWHIDETPGYIQEDERFLARMKFWKNLDLNERENNQIYLR